MSSPYNVKALEKKFIGKFMASKSFCEAWNEIVTTYQTMELIKVQFNNKMSRIFPDLVKYFQSTGRLVSQKILLSNGPKVQQELRRSMELRRMVQDTNRFDVCRLIAVNADVLGAPHIKELAVRHTKER